MAVMPRAIKHCASAKVSRKDFAASETTDGLTADYTDATDGEVRKRGSFLRASVANGGSSSSYQCNPCNPRFKLRFFYVHHSPRPLREKAKINPRLADARLLHRLVRNH